MQNMHIPSEILRKKVVGILGELDHFFDYVILYEASGKEVKEDGVYKIRPSNMSFASLGEPQDIYLVEKYLQHEGIDFQVDFDFENETPTGVVYTNEHGVGDIDNDSVFAELKCDSAQSEQQKVRNLQTKLSAPETVSSKPLKDYQITFTVSGRLSFDEIPIIFSGKEGSFVDCIFEYEKGESVSWDEIDEKFSGDKDVIRGTEETEKVKSAINSTYNRITKKIKDNLGLREDDLLFVRKNSEYWYQFDVIKKPD